MTGNTLTTNPITGTNAYANGAYGTTPQGFWGNTTGLVGGTPFGFTSPAFQPQGMNPVGTVNPFSPTMFGQTGYLGQTTPWQTGVGSNLPFGLQGTLQSVLQTTPPQVVNTILQTTPPQVLPYILNALACQQACQQVLCQNPQAILGINPQAITQPFIQPFPGYGTTNQGTIGFGGIGYNTTPFVGGYPTVTPQGCVGCTPGMQQWNPNVAFQGGFGQMLPQQPWFNTTYGTW